MIANIAVGDRVGLIAQVTPQRINVTGVHLSGVPIPMRIRGTAFQSTEAGWLVSVGNMIYVATDTNVQFVEKVSGERINRDGML